MEEATNAEIMRFLIAGHNNEIVKNAVESLNQFIDDPNFRLYLYDEKGNIFIPEGKIKHALLMY